MRKGSTLRLTALALLWGSSFLWIAIALWAMSPAQIVLVRLALGALVLLAVTRIRHLKLPKDRGVWFHLTVAALFANVIPYLLFAVAEQHVSSSVAGVLNATTPIWTVAVAFAVGTDRRLSRLQLAGLIIGFAGTLMIFSPWESGSQITSWGGLAALGAAASYGISYVYMNHYLIGRGIEPLVLSASQLLAATGLVAVAAPFIGGLDALHPRWDAFLAAAVLGVLGTGVAYVLNYRLIADEGTTASVVTYLLPVVAVALGATVLSEPLTVPVLAGMVIVLAGVALTRRAATRVPPAQKTSPSTQDPAER
ncbi:DMT family transporter [Sphaerisporangium sp. TRM90804]|uniref:DMT family transporter n=1 Tax=Sphaerisporangium sp. TRM90804 TaxID=3031113 RepID=UPI0024483B53|nr:DMT family transporter [Sphaerisporangium sp. TRM90804]MDH2429768.1 DMT family transporter [Sphaerisporangium sp. TRM90804]